MEGSGVSSGGCVVHFDVSYVVGCCIEVAILSRQIWSVLTVCRSCAVHKYAVLGLYCMWGLSYAVKVYCC